MNTIRFKDITIEFEDGVDVEIEGDRIVVRGKPLPAPFVYAPPVVVPITPYPPQIQPFSPWISPNTTGPLPNDPRPFITCGLETTTSTMVARTEDISVCQTTRPDYSKHQVTFTH
jgi:hypothetical protein